jgi:hypothetical protein
MRGRADFIEISFDITGPKTRAKRFKAARRARLEERPVEGQLDGKSRTHRPNGCAASEPVRVT